MSIIELVDFRIAPGDSDYRLLHYCSFKHFCCLCVKNITLKANAMQSDSFFSRTPPRDVTAGKDFALLYEN